MNEDFGCDLAWWHPFVHGHGSANPAGLAAAQSQLIELTSSDESATAGSQGSIKISQLPGIDTADLYYTHTTGALFILREDIVKGQKVRVSFDAKVPAGSTTSRFMRVNRIWGGLSDPTTVALTESWQHFEQVITENYGSTMYIFVFQTTDSQLAIAIPAVGTFLLDNVKVERVVDCASASSEGKACDDGNGCTLSDRCSANACGGITRVCDDADLCTVDQCTAGACVFTPNPGAPGCCSNVVAGQRLPSTATPPVYQQNLKKQCNRTRRTYRFGRMECTRDMYHSCCLLVAQPSLPQ